MKKFVTLKFEDGDNVQEYTFQIKNADMLVWTIFNDCANKRVLANSMKKIMRESKDEAFVSDMICYYRGHISGKEAEAVMKRFPEYEPLQYSLLIHGIYTDNMTIIKKIAQNPLSDRIKIELAPIFKAKGW